MAIPDFQTVMLPLLRLLSDGREYRFRDLVDPVSDHFDLSDEARAESIPSGPQTKMTNRVGWAATHLTKAGVAESPRHGHLRITERGLSLLAENPQRIDLKQLDRYPEHLDFRRGKSAGLSGSASVPEEPLEETRTPSEIMGETYAEIRSGLADELLQQMKSCSPAFFEKLVVDVLVAMGYGGTNPDAGQVLGKSGDGGIDGVIKEDSLGLDVIYIQAKRWERNVPISEVRSFSGAMDAHGANKGVLITTSGFPSSAAIEVGRMQKKIALIGGMELARLMMDHDVGVSTVNSYEIKRVDSDYFEEF